MAQIPRFIDDGKKKSAAINQAFTGPAGTTGADPYYYPFNAYDYFVSGGTITEGMFVGFVPNDYRRVIPAQPTIPYFVGVATHAAASGDPIKVQTKGIYNSAFVLTGAQYEMITFSGVVTPGAADSAGVWGGITLQQLAYRAGVLLEAVSAQRASIIIGPFCFQ